MKITKKSYSHKIDTERLIIDGIVSDLKEEYSRYDTKLPTNSLRIKGDNAEALVEFRTLTNEEKTAILNQPVSYVFNHIKCPGWKYNNELKIIRFSLSILAGPLVGKEITRVIAFNGGIESVIDQ